MAEPDRRVRRTRRTLQEAQVALVVERGYDRITVQEVLDRADVGRSTFYAHFRDKDALFQSCFDDLRDDLQRELGAVDPHGPPVGVIFDHAHRHRQVYRAVCGRAGGNVVTRHLHQLIFDLLRDHLGTVGTSLPVDVVAEYHAGALLAVLVWWVRNDFPYGPERMSQMCQELTAPGVLAGPAPARR